MARSLAMATPLPPPRDHRRSSTLHMSVHPCEKADTIRRFARNYCKANIGFDRNGVQWLDGFIDWSREKDVDACDDKRNFALGSFFGACIIETFGGRWTFVEGSWKLYLDPSCETDPFLSIRLQLERGLPYSVLGAFDAILGAEQGGDKP